MYKEYPELSDEEYRLQCEREDQELENYYDREITRSYTTIGVLGVAIVIVIVVFVWAAI